MLVFLFGTFSLRNASVGDNRLLPGTYRCILSIYEAHNYAFTVIQIIFSFNLFTCLSKATCSPWKVKCYLKTLDGFGRRTLIRGVCANGCWNCDMPDDNQPSVSGTLQKSCLNHAEIPPLPARLQASSFYLDVFFSPLFLRI